MSPASPVTVLQYVGYDVDRGGILAVIRALAAERRFECVLGVNPGFRATRSHTLPRLEFPGIAGEHIHPRTWLRARTVARAVQPWLQADPGRIFHGHSRAGLLVALHLRSLGEERVVVTVNCLGRQRWFYRHAARRLAGRIFWLSPAMKAHYGLTATDRSDCLPPCIPSTGWRDREPRPAEAPVTLGCIGGLVPVKEWERVIDALVRLPASVALRVVQAGGEDGTAESARYAMMIRRRAARPEVGGRFELRGEVTDVARLYRELDAVLIAGTREAFSVAALEAAAAGIPTLAADGPGNRDLVELGRLGWLYPADSAEALARRLTELASDGSLRAWRRHDEALAALAAPASAARHEAIYRRLISR